MLAGKLQSSSSTVDPAWDLANAVYQGSPINWFVLGQTTQQQGVFFKPDGLKMYVIATAIDAVYEYNLSIAWEVSTASFLQSKSVSGEETAPTGVFFKPDGLKMYVVGSNGDEVNEYDLSTAWDISTAVWLQIFILASQDNVPEGIFFKPDGLKMYVIGNINNRVFEYDLSTAWDISTASYLQGKSIGVQDTDPKGVFFKPDGLKMYVLGNQNDRVYEYNLSTAWDVTTASFLQNFSVASQTASPTGVFFKPDGLKMYVVAASNVPTVFQYDLSIAWNLSPVTASFTYPTTNFKSVVTQETFLTGLFFKPDGLKMYVVGPNGDEVNEYDLSTAWDITTASYLQNFYVGGEEAIPQDVFFKPDGLKMYIIGWGTDSVFEYDLSTAWDISTASFLHGKSISAQETIPYGFFFKPDGLKMYIIGGQGQDVNTSDNQSLYNASPVSTLAL